jgi:hypothetical protein
VIETDDLQELRARVATLEAIVRQLMPQPQRRAAGGGDARTGVASRRSLLGFLAGAGAASVLAAPTPAGADAPEPAGPGLGAWTTYAPRLMGEKADPVLGDFKNPKTYPQAGRNGHYWRYGRTVVVKTWIQFGPRAEPGSGQYRLSLPVKAALGSDAWLGPTGLAVLHRGATGVNRNASVVLPHPDFVTFQVDGTDKTVGHDNPWLWATSDGFNTVLIYEAATDP